MANEIKVNTGIQIAVGNYKEQTSPTSFNADMSAAGAAGPTPGSVLATLNGATIDLSKITVKGGIAWFRNTDLTNFIELCMYDADGPKFYPFADILPGEHYPLRLARNYATEYGAGTGTSGSNVVYAARVDPSQPVGTTAMLVALCYNR